MNHFARPYLLLLLIPVVLYSIFYFRKNFHKIAETINLPFQSSERKTSILEKLLFLIPFLRHICIYLLIIAISGPELKSEFLPDEKNGVDLMIAIDVSGSMVSGGDFAPKNRLEVSKELIRDFVKQRVNDRIGIVVFSGAAYLQAPLSGDYEALDEIISDIHDSSVLEQGTAIGDAIILSTYRLKNSKAKSRILILVTDGLSNAGKIDTETASEIAKKFSVKIYTIGIGRDISGSETDFNSLKSISDITEGIFYRATDPEQLEKVLSDIDKLEKNVLQVKPKVFVEPKFEIYIKWVLLLLGIDLLLRAFSLRYFP
ncbi:MAG: VWA domain-containing protein [Leptospiraceae bacterium]|nr:VWA domain-containing protein [Leptospiraceae bacterium]